MIEVGTQLSLSDSDTTKENLLEKIYNNLINLKTFDLLLPPENVLPS